MAWWTTRTWAAGCFALAAGCSQSGQTAEAPARRATPAVAPSPKPAAPAARRPAALSRVLGKREFTLRDRPACEVRFRYAGREPENLFWEEPCAAVTARLITQRDLEGLGRWQQLDSFERKFVTALPGGRVLYVAGTAKASIYPVGTTGTYEVPLRSP